METTETPSDAHEPEGELSLSDTRDIAFGALHDLLSDLYPEGAEDIAAESAWAAYRLLLALTRAAAEGEKDEEA